MTVATYLKTILSRLRFHAAVCFISNECDSERDYMKLQNTDIVIQKNEISTVLWKRWIACYMLYDWNPHHADQTFVLNEIDRYQQVCEKLGDDVVISPELDDLLTKTYNRTLAEDVESFIKTHMEVWKSDRLAVELEMAKAMAEIFESGEE